MTPAQFKAARRHMGITQGALATALGIDIRTAQRYEYGECPIPQTVARLLALISGKRNER